MLCPTCKGTEWVCENHRDKPWDETIEGGCICGAGAPCGTCGGIVGRKDEMNHELKLAMSLASHTCGGTSMVDGGLAILAEIYGPHECIFEVDREGRKSCTRCGNEPTPSTASE